MSPRAVAAVRAALSVLLLARPQVAARALGTDPGGRHHPVLRVLGARHALQALSLVARPTPVVTATVVGVDVAHLLSSVAVAAVSPRHRRVATRAAVLASFLPAATWLAGRRADRPRDVEPPPSPAAVSPTRSAAPVAIVATVRARRRRRGAH